MKLDIVKYGAQVLTQKAQPVTEFDENLKSLVENMFETMYAAPGVGLAAPQVGVSKQLFVMDCTQDKSRQFVFINPEIVSIEGKQRGEEGCLSFPGIYFEVERALRVIVRAQDVTGKTFELDAMDLEARCILHEYDHLEGELYVNRIGPLKREIVMSRIRKAIKNGKWK